ncbi:MAG: lipopolysaccharide heptosyltransferase II [Burkholderiaceae bacterium]|nr:MAG: lipopolysaccharide heptosyltransferase II [Burkholderiaceae bacterium]
MGIEATPRHATLIVAPNWIGDCLMAQPLLMRLKAQGQHLTVLAPPAAAAVFRFMPEVDEVIEAPLAHGKLQWRMRRQLARELRKKFTRAYVLPNSLKSALIPWLARIPVRVGYLGEQRYFLLNQIFRKEKSAERAPMLQHYAALAGVSDASLPNPQLQIPATLIEKTCAEFQLDRARPLIALCPGAEYGPAKRWPAAYFARLAELVSQAQPQAQIILLGSAKDRAIAAEICAATSTPPHNLCGKTTLAQACALIAASNAVVSNDSGLMHIAAACARPQIALFGSSDPRHTPPHSTQAKVEWLHLECSPCFARECPLGHFRCMKELTPERVWGDLVLLLQG